MSRLAHRSMWYWSELGSSSEADVEAQKGLSTSYGTPTNFREIQSDSVGIVSRRTRVLNDCSYYQRQMRRPWRHQQRWRCQLVQWRRPLRHQQRTAVFSATPACSAFSAWIPVFSTVALAFGLKAISVIAITPKSAISDSNTFMIILSSIQRQLDHSFRMRPSSIDFESDPRTTQHTFQWGCYTRF